MVIGVGGLDILQLVCVLLAVPGLLSHSLLELLPLLLQESHLVFQVLHLGDFVLKIRLQSLLVLYDLHLLVTDLVVLVLHLLERSNSPLKNITLPS